MLKGVQVPAALFKISSGWSDFLKCILPDLTPGLVAPNRTPVRPAIDRLSEPVHANTADRNLISVKFREEVVNPGYWRIPGSLKRKTQWH